jgi:hypothetical protein
MTKEEALRQIKEHYGTLDQDKVYNESSSARVGTDHEEDPQGVYTYCKVCGRLEDDKEVDPVYHPEHYL